MAVFTLATDSPSQTDNLSSKSVKLDGKPMDKVRWIAHPIKTVPFSLPDTNYPTDNPS